MTTAYGITYLPRSNKELKELTSRLRDELNEHYSFAPKANARLEEVVLGTLGISSGRQQWQALVKEEEAKDSNFSMSLYINITEDCECDIDKQEPHLELVLDDESVKRIKRVAETARDMGVDMIIRDLEVKDSPSDMIEALVTDTGFFCVSYEKRVRNAWPIRVGQASELSITQLLETFNLAKSLKSTVGVTGFLPHCSQYVYLLPNVWDMSEEIKEDVLDALDSPNDDEAYEYFQFMASGMCNTNGEVTVKQKASEVGLTGPLSSIYDLAMIYEEWLKKQPFFLDEPKEIQDNVLKTLFRLKDRIMLEDTPEMLEIMAEHMEATKFAGEWGVEPAIITEIFHKIEDYRKALRNGTLKRS